MNQTPAGWYQDPSDPGLMRYWDGAAWSEHTSPAAAAQPQQQVAAQPQQVVAPVGAVPATTPFDPDPYQEFVDPRQQFTPAQIEQFKQHALTDFPVWAAVLLHFVTIGIFTAIYQGLKFSKLPLVRHDDFRSDKGIGFLFIPFYNYYWLFRFWLGLTDRLNFQFRIRGLPGEVSRGLALATCIVTVIPYVGVIGFLFVAPVLAAQLQSATNRLVEMRPYG